MFVDIEDLHASTETLLALHAKCPNIVQLQYQIMRCKLNENEHLLRTRVHFSLNLELQSGYTDAAFHCIPQSLPPLLNAGTAPALQILYRPLLLLTHAFKLNIYEKNIAFF